MKNKVLKLITKSIMALTAMALVAACSDGAHLMPKTVAPSITAPSITKFQISKADDSGVPGPSVTIKEGEAVLLEWEVTLAAQEQAQPSEGGEEGDGGISTKGSTEPLEINTSEDQITSGETIDGEETSETAQITLDCDVVGLHEENLPMKGSKVVENITADSVFVLTATYEGSSIPKQVTARVEEKLTAMEVTFGVTPEEVYEGETADLCWQVSRSDATINIIDSNGETLVADNQVVMYYMESTETVEPSLELTGDQEADAESELVLMGAKATALAKQEVVEPEDGSGEGEDVDVSDGEGEGGDVEVVDEGGAGEETTQDDEETVIMSEPEVVDASDCLTIRPYRDTTYYLTVRAPDADPVEDKEASITVKKMLNIESFTVTPDTISSETEVTLSWKVVPAEASVVIAAEGMENILEGGPAEGTTTVTVSDDTTFELQASYEDQSVSTTARVEHDVKFITLTPIVNGTPVAPVIDGTTPQPVLNVEAGTYFEGEQVQIGWNAAVEGGTPDSVQVTVSGVEGVYGTSETVNVPVTGSGNYTITAAGEGYEPVSTTVNVDVRKWIGMAEADGLPVATITPLPDVTDAAMLGYRTDLSKNGDLYVGKMLMEGDSLSSNLLNIPFQSMFEGTGPLAGMWNPSFLQGLDTFPVNAIAIDSTGRTFVGTSGGIVYSDNDGMDWKELILTGYVMNDGDYPGEHRACKGHTMDGTTGWEIASLQQVCDIVVDEVDGRFYAATSHMVVFLANGVDAYLTHPEVPENLWVGMPAANEKGNLAFNTVNHDLEIIRSGATKKIYSASDRGLLVSSDGMTWTTDGIETPVVSVAADTASGKIFVGAEDAMYVRNISGGTWTKVAGVAGPVYSIKIDPVQVGTVYAATAKGVKLSRDGGAKWLDITKGSMAGVEAVEALAVNKVGEKVGIYVATDKGPFASVATVRVTDTVVDDGGDSVGDEGAGEDETAGEGDVGPGGEESGETVTSEEGGELEGPTVGGEDTVTATGAMGNMM